MKNTESIMAAFSIVVWLKKHKLLIKQKSPNSGRCFKNKNTSAAAGLKLSQKMSDLQNNKVFALFDV